mmetsp:Transcript_52688/g.104669  ORF Transcript_52688/g.104669 Transcript_52688/m.104669 type:complete len:122 (+) Transcript_52688:175-540(+)
MCLQLVTATVMHIDSSHRLTSTMVALFALPTTPLLMAAGTGGPLSTTGAVLAPTGSSPAVVFGTTMRATLEVLKGSRAVKLNLYASSWQQVPASAGGVLRACTAATAVPILRPQASVINTK